MFSLSLRTAPTIRRFSTPRSPIPILGLCLVLFLLVMPGSLVADALGSGAPNSGTLGSGTSGSGTLGSGTSGSGSTTQDDEVWVTLGQDLFEQLERNPWALDRALPLEAVASGDGVVITRLPERDLVKVSEFAHQALRRCSGFIVHQTFGEAETALEASRRNIYRALPVQFQISQQTLVGQLLPDITEANILATINHLSTTYNNRYYLNTTGQTSALWIRDLWQGYATGRSDVSVTTYTHSGYPQPSVILTIQGTTLPSEVVVLGGHLDSIKSGATNTDPATIAPGADDNASGIASLSEAIRVLMAQGVTFDRTVKFIGYAAEEVGLRGSADIAADHQAAGTNVVAVMQLDMTDFNGSAEDIALIDDNTNAELSTFTGQLVDTYQPSLVWTTSTCGYACSDHASWHNRGYPAVMPFEAKLGQHNSAIHSSNDNLATLGNSAAHALKFSRLALSFALETALADCTPTAVADAGPDQTICAGDSVQIGTAAQPSHGYSWNPGGATSALLTVSPATTTTYTVTATTSCGNAQDSVQVTVDSGGGGGFDEDFEGGLGGWTTSGLWHLANNSSCASPGYSSASNALYYGQDSSCNYSTGGATSGDLVSPVISGIDSGSTLSFDYFRQVESYSGNYDRTVVSVSVAGSGTWTDVWSRNSSNASENAWTASGDISLASFAGDDIQVRFRFDSVDGTANTFTGFFVDDVVVTGSSSCGPPSNTAPTVAISAPSNGASYTAGDLVSFAGSANDTEDGNLSASIVWSSSLDGSLGTGGSFSTSGLSEGSHVITAAVTDSGGLGDSDTVSITILPAGGGCSTEVDFASGASGWVNSAASTCSTGDFVAATPTAVTNGGVTTQVGGDHTTGSGNAWFTATNSSAGSHDVDGGNCITESPVYAVATASDLSIWYFHGQRDGGDDSGDFFRLELSTNGGSSYAPLVSIGDVTTNAAWTLATASIPAGSQVKLRVQAADGSGPGDLIEAGVDDLSICPTP